ncbi:MAG TPA: YIP1 family protein, partial [Bacteroidota bacterium]|nr:YIP1 family protein [Bacteroidota bacterium]
FSNLAIIVGGGLLIGPIVGQLLTLLFSLLMHRIGRLLGGSGSFRNMHAVTAYSSSPIAYSLVFVFPVEIAIFGIYFFANNPPPLVINPVAYVVLLGLDGVAVLWSWLLFIEGTIVANGFGRGKAVALSVIMLVVAALAAYGIRTL